jgi:predicted DNA-binding protein (MmcQ/YjbR family)
MDIETIRNICLALPDVTESLKWEKDLCFLVGGKMFFVIILDVNSVSFKVNYEEFDELTSRQYIKPAPYAARFNWVLVENMDTFNDDNWEKYINQSYKLVLAGISKKKKNRINYKNESLD